MCMCHCRRWKMLGRLSQGASTAFLAGSCRAGWMSLQPLLRGPAILNEGPRAFPFPTLFTNGACRTYHASPLCMTSGKVHIPIDRLQISYTRSSGPGGQNVNKVNTRVEIRFHVDSAEWLPVDVRQRLAEQQRHRINKDGELIVHSQEHRTQMQNRDDCLRKLEEYLVKAAIVPKERKMRTGLSSEAKEKRLKEKKIRSERKTMRRKGSDWD